MNASTAGAGNGLHDQLVHHRFQCRGAVDPSREFALIGSDLPIGTGATRKNRAAVVDLGITIKTLRVL